MKLDALLRATNLRDIPQYISAIDQLGFDGLWTYEAGNDPFLPLALVAAHSSTLKFGTSIATAFSRSPMIVAYTAWDLAASSNGRFMLGLGTQVKAHNERRFSVEWGQPVARLRDAILGLHAIWHSWRSGERLNYRGEFYKFTLMTPFFSPENQDVGHIPIYIAGVNTGLSKLAGELCDGFHAHPYHSVEYLRDVVRPAIAAGASEAGRNIDDVELSCAVFVITGRDEKETQAMRGMARQQISFYASTPTYKPVMEHHGWGDVADQLQAMAARKKWDEMPGLISDEMLDAYSISAPPDQLADKVIARYNGILDRVTYYLPFEPGHMDEIWQMSTDRFGA